VTYHSKSGIFKIPNIKDIPFKVLPQETYDQRERKRRWYKAERYEGWLVLWSDDWEERKRIFEWENAINM
jgi:hypothetical protein